MTRRVLRVGNCSGFYGDRLGAMREMLEGGHLDVLTGDYLAELTMLILGRDAAKDPSTGYARTFVRQVADNLALAAERGVRLVANAGGLNPAGLATKVREIAAAQGLSLRVAHVEGDDLRPRAESLGLGAPLTANAYLGCFGIAAALQAGADVVVTGRVTDASLTVGAAAAEFGWKPSDLDPLAGATAAGHVLECGTQATGGNFSGFAALGADLAHPGFPLAEIADDGGSVITKHPGTGGAVTVDTVTAQLVYEVDGPAYLGPDVITHLDSLQLSSDGPDRVRISGAVGSAPPETLKVCLNSLGGFRNSVELVLTGLDIEAKAALARRQLEAALAAAPPESVSWDLATTAHDDPRTQAHATAYLRCHVKASDPDRVGRAFSGAAVELALGSYPGFTMTSPPGAATPFGVCTAGYVPQDTVDHVAVLDDGTRIVIPPPTSFGPDPVGLTFPWRLAGESHGSVRLSEGGPTRRVVLGRIVNTRSGDKGGDANVGVWVGTDRRYAWLAGFLDVDRFRALIPEAADLPVEVHHLPNLRAVNVVVRGLLGDGVAASTRFDPQAKALGEWLGARVVDVPEALL
ncbi:MAG: acyclic terpene utilization AtuA family protein [Nocardioidaceae bacterium]